MTNLQTILWLIATIPLAFRAVIDNIQIQRDYREMALSLSDAIAITPETRSSFAGFFLWCARTHQFMILMIVSHLGYFIAYGVSNFEGFLVFSEILIISLIHYPQKKYTAKVLVDFFEVDLPAISRKIEGIDDV